MGPPTHCAWMKRPSYIDKAREGDAERELVGGRARRVADAVLDDELDHDPEQDVGEADVPDAVQDLQGQHDRQTRA